MGGTWRVTTCFSLTLYLPLLYSIMDDIKQQLSSILKRPGSKPATFALTHKLLQDPKVVTAVLGLLLILSVIFCKSPPLPLKYRHTYGSDYWREQDYKKRWTCYCIASRTCGRRKDFYIR